MFGFDTICFDFLRFFENFRENRRNSGKIRMGYLSDFMKNSAGFMTIGQVLGPL